MYKTKIESEQPSIEFDNQLNMEPATTIPATTAAPAKVPGKVPEDDDDEIPDYEAPFVAPPRPAPPKPEIKHPNVQVTIFAKDPDRRTDSPAVPIKFHPYILQISETFAHMVDELKGHDSFEYTVQHHPQAVQIVADWVAHKAEHPDPDLWTPESKIKLMQQRFRKNAPPVVEDPEAHAKVPETLPEWDRSFFHLERMYDVDGTPDNAVEMKGRHPCGLSNKSLFLIVTMVANQLLCNELLLTCRKVFQLAGRRGHLPDEQKAWNAIDKEDLPYWENSYQQRKEEIKVEKPAEKPTTSEEQDDKKPAATGNQAEEEMGDEEPEDELDDA